MVDFTLAEDDEFRARLEIFPRVSAGLRPSDDHTPAGFTGHADSLHYVGASHQVGVDAKCGRLLGLQVIEKGFPVREGRIEDLDVEALLPQMRAEIEDAQRRIGLHDLQLFGIFIEVIAVREQKVWHQDVLAPTRSCSRGRSALEIPASGGSERSESTFLFLHTGSISRTRSHRGW